MIIAASAFTDGLRSDFMGAYEELLFRQQDSNLAKIMDLGVRFTNRRHMFQQWRSGVGRMTFVPYGQSAPATGFDGVQFPGVVHKFMSKIEWLKEDRKDDQTGRFYALAGEYGQSAALTSEDAALDLILDETETLPALAKAADGAALFATTDGAGNDRFGVADGNSLTASGVSAVTDIRSDYYAGLVQWGLMKDPTGRFMRLDRYLRGPGSVLLLHSLSDTEAFEETFLQQRQSVVAGSDAGTTPSNLTEDANRRPTLWAHPRMPSGTWAMFLTAAPMKPLYYAVRDDLTEQRATEDENNSDRVRDSGIESIQWEMRVGAGTSLPYAALLFS